MGGWVGGLADYWLGWASLGLTAVTFSDIVIVIAAAAFCLFVRMKRGRHTLFRT